jgi:hypothetical protein
MGDGTVDMCGFARRGARAVGSVRDRPQPDRANTSRGRALCSPRRIVSRPSGWRCHPADGVAAAFDAGTAGVLARNQPEIGHQLARTGKARQVTQFGDQCCRIDQRHAAHRLQRGHDRSQRPVRQQRLDLRRQPITPRPRRQLRPRRCSPRVRYYARPAQSADPTSQRRCSLVQAGRP